MKTFYVVAGEASGDLLGARLIKALQEKTKGQAQFLGVGGPLMASFGHESIFPMEDLSVMGLFEVLTRLPLLSKRLKQTEQHIKLTKPDALITIDAPSFNFRLAKKLEYQNFPIIHYVAPSVWAWRKDRAKKCAQFLDHLLTLLPFEPPYFTEHNLSTTFVGHSVLESGSDLGDGVSFRQKHQIDLNVPVICLLPGSRITEIDRLTKIFAHTFLKLHRFFPKLKAIVPTFHHLLPKLKPIFRRELGVLYDEVIFIKDIDERYNAFAASDVALAASGTVSLELAMARVPTVIAYRLHPLTGFLAKRILTLKYVSLVNILLDKEVIPEFLQDACTSENLALGIETLLKNPKRAAQQISLAQEALDMLKSGDTTPSEKAADVILKMIG